MACADLSKLHGAEEWGGGGEAAACSHLKGKGEKWIRKVDFKVEKVEWGDVIGIDTRHCDVT